jgi:hypothetical protein
MSSNCRQKLEIEDAKIDKPALLLRPDSQSCHKFNLMTLGRQTLLAHHSSYWDYQGNLTYSQPPLEGLNRISYAQPGVNGLN